MRTYIVGGAVRDALLGREVKDRDWVVVGATADEMRDLGFRQVGRDFPVFLHPRTREEYALARTERKNGHGYTGFVVCSNPEVTLEEDLSRRDLTINAIAQTEDGQLIDPFDGVRDLRGKVFRHISEAFAEDPVRILRLARFAARYPDFTVAAETQALMVEMVAGGEVDHLVAERVWQEFSKGLMEIRPSRMFTVLRQCGALKKLLPEFDRLFGVPQPVEHHPEVDAGIHTLMVVDYAAYTQQPLMVRWACLLHDLGKGETLPEQWPAHHDHEDRSAELARQVCRRLKVPAQCGEFAVLFSREHGRLHRGMEMRAGTLVSMLERLDVFRRPERFGLLLNAALCDCHGRTGYEKRIYPQKQFWSRMADCAGDIDIKKIIQGCHQPQQIAARIHEARVAAVKSCLSRNESG